jgi:hypothetical protein
MKDIIFKFLNRNYSTKLENHVEVIYSYLTNEFQYYDDLIKEFKTIFDLDEYFINQYIHEWVNLDISEYVKIKRIIPNESNYSVASGNYSTVSGNYSVIYAIQNNQTTKINMSVTPRNKETSIYGSFKKWVSLIW